MQTTPTLRRWLAALATAGLFALVVAVISGRSGDGKDDPRGAGKGGDAAAMFGNSPSRNMAIDGAGSLPVEWDIDPKTGKNIKWSVPLGTKAYGGPVVGDGKVFIGMNNEKPLDPKVKGDKGILACFDA